jgi:hypothetical protein
LRNYLQVLALIVKLWDPVLVHSFSQGRHHVLLLIYPALLLLQSFSLALVTGVIVSHALKMVGFKLRVVLHISQSRWRITLRNLSFYWQLYFRSDSTLNWQILRSILRKSGWLKTLKRMSLAIIKSILVSAFVYKLFRFDKLLGVIN